MPEIDEVRRQLARTAESADFGPVRERLSRLGVDDAGLRSLLQRVSHGPRRQDELLGFQARVQEVDLGGPVQFAHYALLRTALWAAGRVAELPIPTRSKQLLLEEFLWLAHPGARELRWLVPGEYVFSALCKLVTLRRFPAGQLHWEVDGLARSSLLRVGVRDLPRVVRAIRRMGGIRPAFVPHLAWRRRQIVLSEREHYRSLALMAEALLLQPDVLGFVALAWFYSPDTAKVSPHLAWASRLFQEWGGVAVVNGRAGPDSGVLVGSRARRERIRGGDFRPTLGLVLWPRDAMMDWARHLNLSHSTSARCHAPPVQR